MKFLFFFFFLLIQFTYSKTVLNWDVLRSYQDHNNSSSAIVLSFDKKMVQISGFILPFIEDESKEMVDRFILVPDPLVSYETSLPHLNQMVYVQMKEPIPIDIDFRGILLTGIFSVKKDGTNRQPYFEFYGFFAKEANLDSRYFSKSYALQSY